MKIYLDFDSGKSVSWGKSSKKNGRSSPTHWTLDNGRTVISESEVPMDDDDMVIGTDKSEVTCVKCHRILLYDEYRKLKDESEYLHPTGWWERKRKQRREDEGAW